jgi:biopolymer transport protein ExbD
LLFFMLSSHFVNQPGIKINLPDAFASKIHPEEDIVISITEGNELYLNEEEVNLGNLLERLRSRISKLGKKTVIIKADAKIDLGLAVKVMDIAKQAEADGLVISTKTEQDVK